MLQTGAKLWPLSQLQAKPLAVAAACFYEGVMRLRHWLYSDAMVPSYRIQDTRRHTFMLYWAHMRLYLWHASASALGNGEGKLLLLLLLCL